ncbi:hypothetical protein SDC9_195682 [bioreactor metagenome]|uniref:Uncharacterized protein n=1 Tax=bioreactor metagenome TaxID=1076179 RepID=A0A645IA00_9ZZZZ
MAMQVDERGHEYEPANVHRSIRAPPVQRAAEDDFTVFDHEVAIAIPGCVNQARVSILRDHFASPSLFLFYKRVRASQYSQAYWFVLASTR